MYTESLFGEKSAHGASSGTQELTRNMRECSQLTEVITVGETT
jgi:hypothetical protein